MAANCSFPTHDDVPPFGDTASSPSSSSSGHINWTKKRGGRANGRSACVAFPPIFDLFRGCWDSRGKETMGLGKKLQEDHEKETCKTKSLCNFAFLWKKGPSSEGSLFRFFVRIKTHDSLIDRSTLPIPPTPTWSVIHAQSLKQIACNAPNR